MRMMNVNKRKGERARDKEVTDIHMSLQLIGSFVGR